MAFPFGATGPAPTPGGGMFGNVPPAGGGMFSNIGDWQNRMIMGGMGMLSGRNPQEQWGNAAQGFAAGSQMDASAKEKADAKREKEELRKRLQQVVQSGGLGSLSPEMQQYVMSDPELGRSLAANSLAPKEAPTTDDIKEFGFAKSQGFKGTFPDWMTQKGAAGAPKNYGSITPDFEMVYDAAGNPLRQKVIEGSKTWLEQKKEREAAAAGAEMKATSGNIVIQDIDRSLGKIRASPGWTTGMGGALLKNVPGTVANDVAKLLTTVKSNAFIDKLQQMRMSSPTGAALGNVTVVEVEKLEAAIGNLEQSQTDTQLIENAERVRQVYSDIIYGKGAAPQPDATGGAVTLSSGGTLTPAADGSQIWSPGQ